jgi:hypothetical protein
MSGANKKGDARTVSAGEYCTMAVAKKYGILDADTYKKNDDKAPFNNLYKDLKSFNSAVDASDGRTKSLCKETMDGKEAYPHCSLMLGPGYKKVGTADPNAPFKCEVYDCPPGFTRHGDYCNKEPLFEDARIDKRARCDERWYDWFLIPNYHLGNKFYEEKVGRCYAPCPVRHVPAFSIDPVDGARFDLTSDDKLDKCVPRDLYFAGKYADGTDYCPLSWILRVYASNPTNAKALIHARRKKVEEMYSNTNDPSKNRLTKQFRDILRMDGDAINKEATYLSNQVKDYLDNVDPPKGPMLQACSTLNTKEHLQMAYNVCKDLEEQGTLQLSSNASRNANQNVVLKQSCNAVFCNENDDGLDIIGRDPICFQKTKRLSDDDLAEEEQEAPAPTYDQQQMFFTRSFRTFMIIVFGSIFITLGALAWTRFIWPKVVRNPLLWIIGKLTGRRFAALRFKEARMEELENIRGEMVRMKSKAY